MEKDVAVIIVNYNTCEYLAGLLDFFRRVKTRLPFTWQLIVVDNGSTDGSLEFLEGRREVMLVSNGENLGYAKAVNKGVAAASAKYVCVMNTDLVLNEPAFRQVWDFMESNPQAYICSPVIYSSNGRMQGFFFRLNILFMYLDFLKNIYMAWAKAAIRHSVRPLRFDGVIGAFVFLRVGLAGPGKKLLDEDYFFYFEDADLALRLKRADIGTYVLPGAGIIHLGSQTGGVENDWRLFYRHKYLFIRKNYGETHARLVRFVDQMKISVKVFKYGFLRRVYPGKRVREKFEYYYNLSSNLKAMSRR